MALLHEASLYLLYASLAAAFFLAVERGIFYLASGRELRQLLSACESGAELPPFKAKGVGSALHEAVAQVRSAPGGLALADEIADRAFIGVHARLNQHLWILDTIVTAAPLLGLLGTILGIFETFTALARSGISDPQGVSAGIGAALLATAVGIAVALTCLVIHNGFLSRVERLSDLSKLVLLEVVTRKERALG